MCLKCHECMKDENIEQNLIDTLNNPNFNEWNGTSLYHLSLSAIGLNGFNNQKMSIQLLNKYVEYKKQHINSPDNSFFGQPSYDRVEKQLLKIDEFNKIRDDNNLTKEDVCNLLYHYNENQDLVKLYPNLDDYFVQMIDTSLNNKPNFFARIYNNMVNYFF